MNIKVMEYNESEQVVAETDALGRTTKFGYDRWGNVEKVIDANGGTEFRLRDANGDLYKRIDKAGHEFNFALDKYGKPFEVSGPEGLFYSLKYNKQGQVEEIREGQIFDDEGNVAEEGASLYLDPETDKRPATRFAYDRYNRLKERKEADGAVHRYKYDCRGNLLRLTYPDGGLSVFDYDEAGRMVKATLCDGRTMRWAYDARGNVIEQTDGRGAKTSYQYDAYDLLKSVTNPKGDAVELSYDGALRLKEVKNALGETYSFERDDAGRVVEEHDFAGRTLKYRLDKAGQVTERLGADNLVTALSYDKLGQLTEVAVFDGERDEKTGKREPRKTAYAYDILGRVTEAINPSAEVKLEYDPLGRVLSETINGQEIKSAYSLKGRTERSIIGLDAPHVANARYDIMGRIRSYQIGNHDPLQFNYNERGLETARGVEGGFYQTQRYSAVGELAEQRVFTGRGARESAQALLRGEQGQQSLLNAQGLKPDQPIAALVAGRDYEYDATGAPRVIADLLHGRTTYQTDGNGQVIQAKHKQANQTITESFQYHPTLDVKGSEVRTETPIGKVLDQSQETWGRRKGGAINKRDGLDWTYDQAGRVTEKVITRNGFRPETHKFEWNGSDQMIGFKKIVNHEVIEAWEYEYDAFGRRVSKTCTHRKATHEANDNQHNDNASRRYQPSQGPDSPAKLSKALRKVTYLWDSNALTAEQKLYADGTTAEVIWHYEGRTEFTPIAREQQEEVAYTISDHLGTIKEVLTEQGQISWAQSHYLWGSAQEQKAAGQAANDDYQPFKFPGQQFDRETGLSYNRFRSFDSLSGYYTSDPSGLRGGANLHSYVANSTMLVDWFGLCAGLASVPDAPGIYTITSTNPKTGALETYVGQATGSMSGRMGGGAASHPKATELLSRPGATMTVQEWDLGTATGADRTRVLRNPEQRQMDAVDKQYEDHPNRKSRNGCRASALSRMADRDGLMSEHGVRAIGDEIPIPC